MAEGSGPRALVITCESQRKEEKNLSSSSSSSSSSSGPSGALSSDTFPVQEHVSDREKTA
ncbi:hypothetical protein EYF80_038814 [Liparis tanakae]|uniref:Uncharacterized protein n=1 Tax=Liparis tanakae TaxID=230148 RepID=A0A4Z2GEB0_9TELE|nr:hypothetical protein EYF80_038814 [Liparis tanakae]